MYIISMVLTSMKMYVEVYLELSQTSMVELLCKKFHSRKSLNNADVSLWT